MIFNEYGEIVTIESNFSMDEWLNESYHIDKILNEGAIAAGAEKAIRWLIDTFMQVADWIGGLKFTKSIGIIKKNKNEIINKMAVALGGGDIARVSKAIDRYIDICKNPSNYTDKSHDDLWNMIMAHENLSANEKAADMVDYVIDSKKYSNQIRRACSELKVMSKKQDINKEFLNDVVKIGKSLIGKVKSGMDSAIKLIMDIFADDKIKVDDQDKKEIKEEVKNYNDRKADSFKDSEDFNKFMGDKNGRLVFD